MYTVIENEQYKYRSYLVHFIREEEEKVCATFRVNTSWSSVPTVTYLGRLDKEGNERNIPEDNIVNVGAVSYDVTRAIAYIQDHMNKAEQATWETLDFSTEGPYPRLYAAFDRHAGNNRYRIGIITSQACVDWYFFSGTILDEMDGIEDKHAEVVLSPGNETIDLAELSISFGELPENVQDALQRICDWNVETSITWPGIPSAVETI